MATPAQAEAGPLLPDIHKGPSNVLVIAGLHDDFFQQPFQWRLLQDHFSVFGKIVERAQFPKIRRVAIVYTTADEARRSRDVLDGKCYGQHRPVKIHYGKARAVVVDPNHVDTTSLAPPPRTKQFLISPPMSPCDGWEQTQEDAPVSNEALSAALACLSNGEKVKIIEGDNTRTRVVPTIFVDPGDTCDDANQAADFEHRPPAITLERFHTATARPPRAQRA